MTTVIRAVRLVDGGAATDDAWIAFADGRVHDRGTGDGWRTVAADRVIDGAGGVLTPGFIDIH